MRGATIPMPRRAVASAAQTSRALLVYGRPQNGSEERYSGKASPALDARGCPEKGAGLSVAGYLSEGSRLQIESFASIVQEVLGRRSA